MKRKTLFSVLLLLVIGCSSTVGQAPMLFIPIVDADFESVDLSGGGQITDPAGCGTGQGFSQIPGWIFQAIIAGAGGGVAHWICDDGMPASNVAYLCCGERMYQFTSEKARQGDYVLQFDVSDWFYSYSGDWNAMLYTGTQDGTGKVTLSQAPFCSASGWSLGDMKRKTVSCGLSGGFINPANVNPDGTLSVAGQVPGNVVILFQNGVPNPALGGHAGWPILIDNVSLTFSPGS